jgi:hypothetical protein
VEGVVAVWLLEQADTKAKVATSTTGTTAMVRRGQEGRIRPILRGTLGANWAFRNISTQDFLTDSPRNRGMERDTGLEPATSGLDGGCCIARWAPRVARIRLQRLSSGLAP